MDKIFNGVNLAGWLFLQFHVGSQLFLDRNSFLESSISLDVTVLKAVQLFQLMDILLIILGKSKGSIFGAFFQLLGRLAVALYFVEEDSDRLRFAMVVICWSLADINRYLYYLFKNNPLTGMLRYNSFIILYPLGVYGEIMLINDFIKRHAENLDDLHINAIRVAQALIIIGMCFLYSYMLKMRKKYYKALKSGTSGTEEESKKVNERSKSPRSKRD